MEQLSLADLEQRLCDLFRRQAALYDQLERKTRDASGDLHSGAEADAKLKEIHTSMVAISELDELIAPLRQQWNSFGTKAGPQLAAVLKQLESLILRVMQHLDQAEEAAVKAKERLEPKLTVQSQRRRMVAAYGAIQSQ